MPLALAGASASLLAACFRGGPAETEAPEAGAGDTGYLVWQTTANGEATTTWLDADGRERGRASGRWLAVDGALLVERRVVRDRATTGCRERDDGTLEAGQAHLDEVWLERAGAAPGAAARVAVSPAAWPGDIEEVAEWTQAVTVRASLGPLVFGERATDVFACGAHGSVGMTAFVLDTRAGHLREVAERPASEALASLIAAAVVADHAEASGGPSGGPIEPIDEDARWRLVETLPAWRAGVLGARALAVVDACYACGNGMWSSYTAGVWIDPGAPPAGWTALARGLPRPVAARLAAGDGRDQGVSWGPVDARWQAAFARTLAGLRTAER